MTSVWNGHATCHHRTYRIDCAQYDRMLQRANGQCEICGKSASETPDNRLVIDHDHRGGTGWNHVRGLLCTKCNCNLKYPERGDRPFTDAEKRYLANAWCALQPPPAVVALVPVEWVRISVDIPRDLRDDFARLLSVRREDRNRVATTLVRQYVRRHRKLLDTPEEGSTDPTPS